MSPFVLAYAIGGTFAVALAWLRGGHAEREGAMIWTVNWTMCWVLGDIEIGGLQAGVALVDLLSLVAIVWLALRYDRWWPLGVAACMTLWMAVHAAEMLVPELGRFAALSAQLGPGLLGVLFLGLGVAERWLAEEPPVSRLGPGRPAGAASSARRRWWPPVVKTVTAPAHGDLNI